MSEERRTLTLNRRKPRPGAGLFAKLPMTEPRMVLNLGEHATQMLTAQTLDEVDAVFCGAVKLARKH